MKPNKLKKRGALLLADEEKVKSRGGSEKFEFALTSKAACKPKFRTVCFLLSEFDQETARIALKSVLLRGVLLFKCIQLR